MALRARRCAIRKKNIIKKKLIKNFEIAYGVAWSKVRSRIRSGGGVNSFETSYGVACSKVGKRRWRRKRWRKRRRPHMAWLGQRLGRGDGRGHAHQQRCPWGHICAEDVLACTRSVLKET